MELVSSLLAMTWIPLARSFKTFQIITSSELSNYNKPTIPSDRHHNGVRTPALRQSKEES